MEILFVLLVLLIATRSLGELAVRVGQPALVVVHKDEASSSRRWTRRS